MIIVIGITSIILIMQVIGGIVGNSLALLSDAAHVGTDIFGVTLALIATYLAARPATPERTFGWYRLEILAAVANAVLLFAIAFWVLKEAWGRFSEPPEVASGFVLIIALIGLAINGISLWMLHNGQKESLNVRGAYLEVLGDLLGSVAVVIAAGVIGLTGWNVADPIAAVVVGFMILPRAWKLLKDALDVLLESTPKHVDLDEVRKHLLEVEGVVEVHDLHAWTITSGLPMLTAHVVVEEEILCGGSCGPVLDRLHDCLKGHFDVEHSTFQLEPVGHSSHEGAGHH